LFPYYVKTIDKLTQNNPSFPPISRFRRAASISTTDERPIYPDQHGLEPSSGGRALNAVVLSSTY
jgi:hypothetical protein